VGYAADTLAQLEAHLWAGKGLGNKQQVNGAPAAEQFGLTGISSSLERNLFGEGGDWQICRRG